MPASPHFKPGQAEALFDILDNMAQRRPKPAVRKPTPSPRPRRKGLAAFTREVEAYTPQTGRTTILPLLRRAMDDFGLPADYIQPSVPVTTDTVRNWLKGKGTPNWHARESLQKLILRFVRKEDLGPPASEFIALRKALVRHNTDQIEGFLPLLQEARRLGCNFHRIAEMARVPYHTIEGWFENHTSLTFQRERVVEAMIKKWLWNYAP